MAFKRSGKKETLATFQKKSEVAAKIPNVNRNMILVKHSHSLTTLRLNPYPSNARLSSYSYESNDLASLTVNTPLLVVRMTDMFDVLFWECISRLQRMWNKVCSRDLLEETTCTQRPVSLLALTKLNIRVRIPRDLWDSKMSPSATKIRGSPAAIMPIFYILGF